MADAGQTINIPQLLVVLLLGSLAIRYFFFAPANGAGRTGVGGRGQNMRAREADVERVQQMFPQLSRRHIIWDLQRNGGNVVATTERILSGRGLENPPVSFQPPAPEPSSATTATAVSTSNKPQQPDLIKRYNLQSLVEKESSSSVEPEAATPPSKQAWSQNKDERQALLRRRREEMIMAARKKMQAKLAENETAPPPSEPQA